MGQTKTETENRGFSCKNLPKPTDSKIFETVTTLLPAHTGVIPEQMANKESLSLLFSFNKLISTAIRL